MPIRRPLLALCLATAVPAAAQSLLEELPLERGFYVRTDESCAGATSAGTAVLRRAGLQWVTSYCLFDRIEEAGPGRYTVTQACGDAARTERATALYEIADRTSFAFVDSNGWQHAARLCAQADMPEPWRSSDISDLID